MTPPSPTILRQWLSRWRAIRSEAYQLLIASYTPEQRELQQRMNYAGSRANYIRDWLSQPERCKVLPEEPPNDD